jgi:type I restriction enzyme M protein
MAIKKSDLYSKLWQSCDELRGGMDASQYKDYVLILLFVKYVTDKYYDKPDSLLIVPDGGSFHDMVKLKGNSEIGDKMNTIIHNLAEENELVGVIRIGKIQRAILHTGGSIQGNGKGNRCGKFKEPGRYHL